MKIKPFELGAVVTIGKTSYEIIAEVLKVPDKFKMQAYYKSLADKGVEKEYVVRHTKTKTVYNLLKYKTGKLEIV